MWTPPEKRFFATISKDTDKATGNDSLPASYELKENGLGITIDTMARWEAAVASRRNRKAPRAEPHLHQRDRPRRNSYLIQLLTALGCDTGFPIRRHPDDGSGNNYFDVARAGFELDIMTLDGPAIIKSPFLCDNVDKVLAADITITHVIIPVRDFRSAAESRAYVQQLTTGARDGESVGGGLWDTTDSTRQEDVLRSKLANLVEACVRNDIPMTFLSFPKFANDPDYLFDRIQFILPADVERDRFRSVFRSVVRTDLIHDFSRADVSNA